MGVVAIHTLDRPATTHKRQATLSDPSWAQDASSHSSPHDRGIRGNDLPAYFTSTVPGAIEFSSGRRRVSSKEHRLIRRILPRPFASPALCRGDAVRPASVGVDPVLDTGEEQFQFGSRPSTPSGLFHFFSSPGPEVETTEQDSSSVPRRSNSVNKLLQSTNLKNRSRTLKISLGSRRVISAPASTMASNAEENVGQPQVKRQHLNYEAGDHLSDSLHHSNTPDPYAHTDSHDDMPPPLEAHNSSPSMPPTSLRTPPSNTSFTSISKRSRHSAAFSDVNSSQPGSESDGKVFSSADEDEMRSDTAYDSVRTGMTKSSSGYQRPTLETLFDKDSPPPHHHDPDTALHYFGKGSSISPITTKGHTIAEEDSSTSTPGRTIVPERRGSQEREPELNKPSSPPAAPKELNLGRLSWDSADSKKSVRWPESIEEEDWDADPFQATPSDWRTGHVDDPLGSVRRKLDFFNVREETEETDPRATIFDWSEPTSIDRGMTDSPPPRPKTVHGRKNPDASGGKAATRRAPSGLHARSHSVPVLADLVGQRSTVSKFGTWGIGSKGVTEDWNDDFDFDVEEPPAKAGAQALDEETHNQASAPTTMVIPATIRASQTNVLANVGLLKEWGILIEELKDLRSKAAALSIEQEHHATVFDEVDAMIDLADQEHDDSSFPSRQTPTSSPGFDFDDSSPSTSALASTARNSQALESDLDAESGLSTPVRTSFASETPQRSETPAVRTRPRKDSEAVAQTVIEALQQRRRPKYLSTPDQPHVKKIPFDTRTLRKIVPHVSNLVKSVKQIIREAENLQSSPKASRHITQEALQNAFVAPVSENHTEQRHMHGERTPPDDAVEGVSQDPEDSCGGRSSPLTTTSQGRLSETSPPP